MRLIENDCFPFEFLSRIAEHESWRKEIHRPVYHVHKWWAKRLGSVFRGILLGCLLPDSCDLESAFYETYSFRGTCVFDPFIGSGTTIGEAHKLGLTALGRDINPVAVEAVRVALGPLDAALLERDFAELSRTVGERIRALYRSTDSLGRPCDVLYYFWVMQVPCAMCRQEVELLSSWVIARNAYPDRKPAVQILCPRCGIIFPGLSGVLQVCCPSCDLSFDPRRGPAEGAKATCSRCSGVFSIISAIAATGQHPSYRLYGKLVLTADHTKEYLPADEADQTLYRTSAGMLNTDVAEGRVKLPNLNLEDGHNTRQVMRYGVKSWRDFFNCRQLLALGWLHGAISRIEDAQARNAFRILFSGILEFNNMFASYKGEGTGAVRHMFSHHILKPERAPIEANVWGTSKSSGSFSGLFRGRLLRAIDYRRAPVEVCAEERRVCSPPFSGTVEAEWPVNTPFTERGIYLSCGDSTVTHLPHCSVDLVVTDPPFFDNVHYSELADFFYSWQQIGKEEEGRSTRDSREVQDVDAKEFASKLRGVLQECHRVLKDDGLLAFTYHHSRDDGWRAVAEALLGAGFLVVNSHPVKSEMAGATPKSQAKEPIHLDVIIVCRKARALAGTLPKLPEDAISSARDKLRRLSYGGALLSRNDRRVVLFGQLLMVVRHPDDVSLISALVEEVLHCYDCIDLA